MPSAPRPSEVLAERLERWRNRRRVDGGRLTTEKLAKLMAEHGQPIHPTAITKIEKGERGVTLDELIVFAAVLNVPPVALILPLDGSHSRVHLTTKSEIHPHLALEWVVGDEPLATTQRTATYSKDWREGSYEVRLWRRLRGAQDAVQKAYFAVERASWTKDEAATINARKAYVERLKDLVEVRTSMERAGITPPRLPRTQWGPDVKKLHLEETD